MRYEGYIYLTYGYLGVTQEIQLIYRNIDLYYPEIYINWIGKKRHQ